MLRPEPTPVFSDLVFGLREVVSSAKNLPSRMEVRAKAKRLIYSDGSDPVVNYGRLSSPVANALPIGGEIKLIPLKARFPEQSEKFNLLYLVSSALPQHAEEVVAGAKRKGCKLVWNQNGVAYPGCYGNYYPWFNRRMAALFASADSVVYQSRFSQLSAEKYLGTSHAESQVLFNPVDPVQFSPGEHGQRAENEGVWRILAAGTSHAWYRTRSALEVLQVLRKRGCNARLILAGEQRWPGAMSQVERLIRETGLKEHVEFHPPFSQSEAPDLYRSADVLLHTKYKDPCPTVPIEAMACGLPVVGLDSGGMPELVPVGCGILCPVPDRWDCDLAAKPEALADGVEQVMQSRTSFSEKARRHAEQTFAVENWLQRHAEIFKDLLQ